MFKQWIITIFALLCVLVSVNNAIMQEAHSSLITYNKSAVIHKTRSQMTRTPVFSVGSAFQYGFCRQILNFSLYTDWFDKSQYHERCTEQNVHDISYRYVNKFYYGLGFTVAMLFDPRVLIPLLVGAYFYRRWIGKSIKRLWGVSVVPVWRFGLGLVRLILFWVGRLCRIIARIARNISHNTYINDTQGK